MKVVKKAETWNGTQVACGFCKAVLEVEFADLRRVHHPAGPDQRDPAWDEVCVTCPECARSIGIDGVPEHLVIRIPTF